EAGALLVKAFQVRNGLSVSADAGVYVSKNRRNNYYIRFGYTGKKFMCPDGIFATVGRDMLLEANIFHVKNGFLTEDSKKFVGSLKCSKGGCNTLYSPVLRNENGDLHVYLLLVNKDTHKFVAIHP